MATFAYIYSCALRAAFISAMLNAAFALLNVIFYEYLRLGAERCFEWL